MELWRQERQLVNSFPSIGDMGIRNGWRWETISRRMLLFGLIVLVFATVLARHHPTLIADRNDWRLFDTEWIFPKLCLNVVLVFALLVTAPIGIKPQRDDLHRLIELVALWFFASLVVILMISYALQTHFFVHLAAAGIEKSRALRLQRPGSYPSSLVEGWWNLKLAAVASVLLLVASVSLFAAILFRMRNRNRAFCLLLFLLSIFSVATYVSWFYGTELHRLSPDIASELGPREPRDWLAAFVLVSTVTAAGSVRLCQGNSEAESQPADSSFQTGTIILLAIVPLVILAFGPLALEFVKFMVEKLQMGMVPSYIPRALSEEVLSHWFENPERLLQLGTSVLALQITWRWWRRGAPEIVIQPIEPQRVFWAWLGLTALVIVAVPVLAAFGFSWWLGPWYLR
jgi:hypothetical protein